MKEHTIAVKANDREIASVIFAGREVIFSEVLSAPTGETLKSDVVQGVISRLIEVYRPTSAVFDCADEHLETHGEIKGLLRNAGIPINYVEQQEMFDSFALPAVTSREQLRAITSRLFPKLPNLPHAAGMLDAAALGLYFQTERLLKSN